MKYFNDKVVQEKLYQKHKTIDNVKLKKYLKEAMLKNGIQQSDNTIAKKFSGHMPYTFSDVLQLKNYFKCELKELLTVECIKKYF